ncbi:MAG: LLM class F420-dependent oxidoreductase [Proteobacteria bacterium]|nr:LLM class F420-dependent oxidoreductase [Pseudomonadota bacterium]
MDIGIAQPVANQDAPADVIAKHAEDLGFESYWAPDHTILPVKYSVDYPGGRPGDPEPEYLWQIADPLIMLAHVAGVTKTIKLATGVLLVPERDAILCAKLIASLDDCSNGRFLFGIGAGWNPEECTILGGDFEHRWTHTKENIAVMKALWTEHAPEFHGKYNDFPPIRCYPKPRQDPHPPILLGAINNALSLKRVADWGDGWMPVIQSADELAAGIKQIKGFCAASGRDASRMDYSVFGIGDQWKTKRDIEALGKAGANRVIVMLTPGAKKDQLKAELDQLRKTLF